MSTPHRITTGKPDEHPRTVYVVRKTRPGVGMGRFVAADCTPAGTPREYPTLAEAQAVAARMGGPAAGLSVFTEFRTAAGAPCAGHYIQTGVEPE